MAALLSRHADRSRLEKIVGMLSSSFDGERLIALDMLQNMADEYKVPIHELLLGAESARAGFKLRSTASRSRLSAERVKLSFGRSELNKRSEAQNTRPAEPAPERRNSHRTGETISKAQREQPLAAVSDSVGNELRRRFDRQRHALAVAETGRRDPSHSRESRRVQRSERRRRLGRRPMNREEIVSVRQRLLDRQFQPIACLQLGLSKHPGEASRQAPERNRVARTRRHAALSRRGAEYRRSDRSSSTRSISISKTRRSSPRSSRWPRSSSAGRLSAAGRTLRAVSCHIGSRTATRERSSFSCHAASSNF